MFCFEGYMFVIIIREGYLCVCIKKVDVRDRLFNRGCVMIICLLEVFCICFNVNICICDIFG